MNMGNLLASMHNKDNTEEQKEWDLEDHILGTIYGNCIGDAIGLLTEFMVKDEASKYYGKISKSKEGLQYENKVPDFHRNRWVNGDWTDDSDQMIMIIQSLLDNNGNVDPIDYGKRLLYWCRNGFPELGDHGGMGIGATTHGVLHHPIFKTNPHKAAEDIWEGSGRFAAPNGAVMRTSILGIHNYDKLDSVIQNTLDICKTTHHDPRCQASCVAVTTAIAFMLQRTPKHIDENGQYKLTTIIDDAYNEALKLIPDDQTDMRNELHQHMYAKSIKELKLDEHKKIGYTYKCLGAGFWALRQNNFKKALTELVMEAGDADTNGAVAGALLGCKLGAVKLPPDWYIKLKHKTWLDKIIERFLWMDFKIVHPAHDEDKSISDEYKEAEGENKDKSKNNEAADEHVSSEVQPAAKENSQETSSNNADSDRKQLESMCTKLEEDAHSSNEDKGKTIDEKNDEDPVPELALTEKQES